MKENRLSQLGNIRAFAIFLVVLGHSIILYSGSWDLYQTDLSVPFLDQLKRLIDVPQMLLFFSLSGYLFCFTHSKKRGFLHLLKNKALRLLLPYFGIGLCWLLPIRLLIRYPGYVGISPLTMVKNFLTSTDVGHLWFLPALFFVFLLAEVILQIAEAIPGIRKFPDIVLGLCAGLLYLEGYRIGFGYPPILSAFAWLLWFSVGYILNARKELFLKIYHFIGVKWLLLAANVALLVLYMLGKPMGVILSLIMRGLCIVNAFGMIPKKSCDVLERVDRNSFGVYLFHSPLIYITFALIPNAHPVLVVTLNLVVFGVVAYFLTELVRKTKLRILIGE